MNNLDKRASLDTRERLLQAGGEIFARRGYRRATVREICGLAGANVAAVNYHFKDKRGLYQAVLEHTCRSAMEKYPSDGRLPEGASPEERLHAFVKSFLFRIHDDGLPAWHGKLMAREIIEPTDALDQMVENIIRPLHEYLKTVVLQFLGPDADEETVRLCTLSIVGQCVFYYHSRPVIDRLYALQYSREEIERLARHITEFSAGAMRASSRLTLSVKRMPAAAIAASS